MLPGQGTALQKCTPQHAFKTCTCFQEKERPSKKFTPQDAFSTRKGPSKLSIELLGGLSQRQALLSEPSPTLEHGDRRVHLRGRSPRGEPVQARCLRESRWRKRASTSALPTRGSRPRRGASTGALPARASRPRRRASTPARRGAGPWPAPGQAPSPTPLPRAPRPAATPSPPPALPPTRKTLPLKNQNLQPTACLTPWVSFLPVDQRCFPKQITTPAIRLVAWLH